MNCVGVKSMFKREQLITNGIEERGKQRKIVNYPSSPVVFKYVPWIQPFVFVRSFRISEFLSFEPKAAKKINGEQQIETKNFHLDYFKLTVV